MSPKARHVLAREHLDRALSGVTAEDYTEDEPDLDGQTTERWFLAREAQALKA